ncbi:hypothetical protein Poly51_08300 [Rubripirellula tenax]|uniref:Uncharacterized protein n=1 Tax=Rubripirellula tenax TaxID=2528015 RepID=A0A5C6FIZ4_9BACT|nr:hypothetical protein Poly51_08300 [Rubripirellula tenax]
MLRETSKRNISTYESLMKERLVFRFETEEWEARRLQLVDVALEKLRVDRKRNALSRCGRNA